MASIYDTVLKNRDEAAKRNVYTGILQDRDTRERRTALRVVGSNPDEAARAQSLSRDTGIPAPVVSRNLPEVTKKAALTKYDAILAGNPDLARAMRNEELAAVAHDDLENLSALQKTAGFFSRAAEVAYAGVHDAAAGFYGVGQAVSEQLATDVDRFLVKPGIFPANPAAQAAKFFAGKRQNAAAYADMLVGDMRDAGIIERGAVSGVRSLAGNVPLIAGAALTRSPRLALTGMSGIVGGRSYGEGRDQGLSPNAAAVYGATDATIELVTERLPVLRLLDDFAKNSGLLKTLTAQLALEIPGEQAATALQDLNAWATLPENVDKTLSDYMAARPGAAAETLVATIVAVGAQTGSVQAVDSVAKRIAGEGDKADAAAATAERLQAVNRMAAASKLRERSPEQFAKFVEDAAPGSDLYIKADDLVDVLNQSGFEGDLPAEIAERIEEADLIEGDVRISLSEFATVFGGKTGDALIPHLRTSPDGLSLSESETFAQSGIREQFEADAESESALEQDAAESERRAGNESVRQRVQDGLDLLGRFTPEANELYARLTSSFYETQAARLGMTAEELYDAMPLNIVAESPLAPAFSATDRRGAFQPDTNTIAILKNADLSTYLHESGHFFLNALEQFAGREDVPADIAADMDTLLGWFGVEDLATWRAMTLEQKREHHENFARGFEAYLFEGKAPSAELQAIFARFRTWLVNVYKSLRGLNVELTPEVRQVFDRMLATDAQIQNKEAMQSYAPLFESAEAAGMTEAEFADYQALGANASQQATEQLQKRTLRDMAWLSNAKSRVLKALQKDAAGKRNAIRAEVKTEVEREPIYRARRFLTKGEIERDGEVIKVDDHKLSKQALEELYPDGEVDYSQLTRSKAISAKGGLHPDALAELLGFTSGDQLMRALEITPPINDTVEALTDQRMLETYGDITDLATLERAAESVIANDMRAKFLARELAGIRKSLGSWPMLVRGANDYARAAVARRRIKELRPYQFTVAEAQASRAAAKAFKAADTDQAAMHKRSQLVANRLGKAARDAVDEVERSLAYLRRLNSKAARKRIGPEYSEQIDALLERHDLRKSVTRKELERRASLLEWVESQRDAGFEPDESVLELLNEARRTHYKDLTVQEFRGLVDAVKNIEHLGKLKTTLLTARDKRRFDEAVEDAANTIESNATRTRKDELESNLPADEAKSLWRGFFASHRKFASIARTFDGHKDGGTIWSLFVRPLNDAADKEASMREDATIKLAEIFKGVKGLHKKTFIPAINDSLTKEGRLSIALNTGTETNRKRLLDGDRWTPGQLQAVLDTLTKEDWQFVENVWQFIGSYWEQIEAKQKMVTGIAPERVEGIQVETKFGPIQGAYFPISYDPGRSSKSSADVDAEAIRQTMQGLYTRSTTRRGHTKARTETVLRPMRKDLGVITQHVEQVIHDLSFHAALIDLNRLLRAPAVDEAIRRHYSPEILRTLNDTLRDVAVGDAVAMTSIEKIFSPLRKGVTVAFLGWNLSTAALQPLGLTQGFVRIGPKYIGRGLAQFLGGAVRMEGTIASIYERSDFMRLRGKTLNREIGEIRNRIKGSGKRAAVEASYFYFIQKMQVLADVPIWLGAHAKAIDNGATADDAVSLADQAVRDSQGGGATHDLSEIQRGSALQRLFTNFYSYMNVTLNLTAESVSRTKFKDPLSVGLFAVDMLMLYSVPTFLAMTLREALRGDEDDDEPLWSKYAKEQLGFLLGTLVGGRELSSAVQGYDYAGPAGLRFFAEMSRLYEQAGQGEVDAAALSALNKSAGILFKYPAGQVERTVEGAIAVSEGDAPVSAVIFGKPRE